jgi:hypothetical protein
LSEINRPQKKLGEFRAGGALGPASIEPNDSSGEVDCSEKIPRGFVVACGDGALLFELAEEVLHEMSRLVGVLVEIPLSFAVASGRNNERLSAGEQRFNHTFVSLEGFVSQQGIGRHVGQQRVGAPQIVNLTRRQQKPQRIASVRAMRTLEGFPAPAGTAWT